MTYKVLADGLRFPEAPVAMPDGSVYLAEIETGHLIHVRPNGEITVVAQCGNGLNGLALGPGGLLYACNNGGLVWAHREDGMFPGHGTPKNYSGGRIQTINPSTGEVRTLYENCEGRLLRSPNDLVFDAFGGFYFTDYGKTRERERDFGSVFYARADGSSIREVVHPISSPNGIGLSPDQTILYISETETCRLWAFTILSPGVLDLCPFPSPSGGRLVHGLGGYQKFDSMAVQANGDICVATLISSQFTVISAEGHIVEEVAVPDLFPTNLCFGGGDMKTAYMTFSYTGQLVEMRWSSPGLKLNF